MSELRRLRRMSGQWSIERLDGMNVLVDYCGHGNVHNAYHTLEALRKRHGSDPHSDIAAYFYTAGWKLGQATLDQRLHRYARKFHVVERTALRRSDRGASQIATLIRSVEMYDRPLGRLYCFQRGSVVSTKLYLIVERGASWRRPSVYLNGTKQPRQEWELHTSSMKEYLLEGREEYDLVELDYSVPELEALATIMVIWPMPVWPQWDVTTHILDNRLFAHTELSTSGRIEVHFKWWNDGARKTGSETLELPGWL
ncbi:MAG: hypothetical protein V9F04_11085 [Dermatophilaceae bacterium]